MATVGSKKLNSTITTDDTEALPVLFACPPCQNKQIIYHFCLPKLQLRF